MAETSGYKTAAGNNTFLTVQSYYEPRTQN